MFEDLVPEIVSGQVDVRPTEWRDVAKKVRVWELPNRSEMVGGPSDIGRVPKDDGSDDQVERSGAALLSGPGPVVDMPLGVREDGAGEGVSCLAFAKPRLASLTELGIFEPVEHEQCTFDSADFTKGQMKTVLASIGAEFAQHIGELWCTRLGLLAYKRDDLRRLRHERHGKHHQRFFDKPCECGRRLRFRSLASLIGVVTS